MEWKSDRSFVRWKQMPSQPVQETIEVVKKLNETLSASVRPLFVEDEDKRRWNPLGSCVLVSLEGHKFAFTAGHVMSQSGYRNQSNQAAVALVTPTGRFVPFANWTAVFTGRLGGSPDPDVGVVRIADHGSSALDDCHFLAENRWQLNHEDDRSTESFYMLIGYPGARGLIKTWNRQIRRLGNVHVAFAPTLRRSGGTKN